jgi:hypothetical protein
MTVTTGTAASSSQGAPARTCTFCASCNKIPQEIAGGRRPRPRNDKDVSLMIMAGSASDTAAITWLVKDGSMWRSMMRN